MKNKDEVRVLRTEVHGCFDCPVCHVNVEWGNIECGMNTSFGNEEFKDELEFENWGKGKRYKNDEPWIFNSSGCSFPLNCPLERVRYKRGEGAKAVHDEVDIEPMTKPVGPILYERYRVKGHRGDST